MFADPLVNAAGTKGLLLGGTDFFGKQLATIIGSSLYAFLFTYIMLSAINRLTPVKVEEEAEQTGLDEVIHGEKAYDTI